MRHAPLLFGSWAEVVRSVVMAGAVYLALVAALRVLGERALAKMSAYDLVVTVALGSMLAAIPLQTSVSLVDGLAAVFTLLLLQHFLTWVLARVPRTRRLVKAQPTLLLYDGHMLPERMHHLNVTSDEIRAAVRSQGMAALEDCLAVVLESDGNWSVVPYDDRAAHSALEGLDLPTEPPTGRRRSSAHQQKAAATKQLP